MERMRKTRKKQPHFYGYIGILSLCVAAALLIPQHCVRQIVPMGLVLISDAVLIIGGITVFLYFGKGIRLKDDGIVFCWYGIRYRKVPWEKIRQIGVLTVKNLGWCAIPELTVIPKGCHPFVPGHLFRRRSHRLHSRGIQTVVIRPKDLELLKPYYGTPDFIYPERRL